MSKTVFFLGAGATKAILNGAPLNSDLVRRAINNCDDEDLVGGLKDFIEDLFNPPIDNQLWNLLDYIVQERKSPSPKYSLEKIVELREKLLALIIVELKNSLSGGSKNELDKNFIYKIKKIDCSIISANYDILVDDALINHANQNINYGVKIRYSVKLNGSDEPKRFIANTGEQHLNKGKIPLLKLHGSLNWLYCRKCDEVDVILGEKIEARDINKKYCCNVYCTKTYEPLIIAPTMFKNYDNRIIKETWHIAEKELIEAENLVFIGYALKEEDYHVRCLLMKALLNKEKNYKKVIVVEWDDQNDKKKKELEEKVGAHYKNLYGERAVDFGTNGFGNFIKDFDSFGLDE